MTSRPRAFVELCCGSAAVTMRLLGGRYAQPPIAYMGGKRSFAAAILGAMGLRPSDGADQVLLCDAGPWAHAWAVLADRESCLHVAAVLRGWAGENPRELWERLRDEHRGAWSEWTAERVAGWLWLQGRTVSSAPLWYDDDGEQVIPEKGNRGVQVKPAVQRGSWGGDERRAPGIQRPATVAERVEAVASWLYSGHFCYRAGIPESGFAPVHARTRPKTATDHGAGPRTPLTVARHLDGIPAAPMAVYAGRAEDVPVPDDCDGVYVYIDPPYVGCTRYAADMPREAVIDVARRWSDAGAVVCISEAEPLPLDGWYHVEITGARGGQARTNSRQKREWITLNREPAHVPAVQAEMFNA